MQMPPINPAEYRTLGDLHDIACRRTRAEVELNDIETRCKQPSSSNPTALPAADHDDSVIRENLGVGDGHRCEGLMNLNDTSRRNSSAYRSLRSATPAASGLIESEGASGRPARCHPSDGSATRQRQGA